LRVLVTGADGFVGRWVVRGLLEHGCEVVAAVRPESGGVPAMTSRGGASVVGLELSDPASIRAALASPLDGLVHLAAVSSGVDARRDPIHAWEVNTVGTARLVEELAEQRRAGRMDPVVIIASTGEVYGPRARTPSRETDPLEPCSPYAASKCGAELAARETAARSGLRVITARPFTQCGPGQDDRFFVPATVRRLLDARRERRRSIPVGNLEPVRDFLDVRDAADAVVALLERGVAGETYNVASGNGLSLRDVFTQLAQIIGVDASPEPDPALMRPADIPYLVGDPGRLAAATGWTPRVPMRQTLTDVVASAERRVAATA
jgi:GDP-4-dehydro-6-deoxy-D-mannose reductase